MLVRAARVTTFSCLDSTWYGPSTIYFVLHALMRWLGRLGRVNDDVHVPQRLSSDDESMSRIVRFLALPCMDRHVAIGSLYHQRRGLAHGSPLCLCAVRRQPPLMRSSRLICLVTEKSTFAPLPKTQQVHCLSSARTVRRASMNRPSGIV